MPNPNHFGDWRDNATKISTDIFMAALYRVDEEKRAALARGDTQVAQDIVQRAMEGAVDDAARAMAMEYAFAEFFPNAEPRTKRQSESSSGGVAHKAGAEFGDCRA